MRAGPFDDQHLAELVQVVETEGAAATERLNDAAAVMLAAYAEREQAAQRIFSLAALVGSTEPGDVSRSRCEPLADAARRLLEAGGENPPQLTRDPRSVENAAPVPA